MPKKKIWIISAFVLAAIVFTVALLFVWLYIAESLNKDDEEPDSSGFICGGIAGITCQEGYFCRYDNDYPDAAGVCLLLDEPKKNINGVKNQTPSFYDENEDVVEYNASYGDVCPIGVKFLVSRTAAKMECACPEGYEFDQNMIGGEECYDGAECPIFSTECVPKTK